MTMEYKEVRKVFIAGLIDAVPDQRAARELLQADPAFFEKRTMQQIFEELNIESLGRMLFIDVIDTVLISPIPDPRVFFSENANKTLDLVIADLIAKNHVSGITR